MKWWFHVVDHNGPCSPFAQIQQFKGLNVMGSTALKDFDIDSILLFRIFVPTIVDIARLKILIEYLRDWVRTRVSQSITTIRLWICKN